MEDEARLLQAFSSLPAVARGWAFPAATHDGVRLTLQMQQRNLPANAQRKYLASFLLNEAVLEAGEVDASPPAEQQGSTTTSPERLARHPSAFLPCRRGTAAAPQHSQYRLKEAASCHKSGAAGRSSRHTTSGRPLSMRQAGLWL